MFTRGFCLLVLCFLTLWSAAQTSVTIDSIAIEGNHKTQEFVLLREMVLEANVPYEAEDFEARLIQSQKNLMNTRLFNFATLTTDSLRPGHVQLNVAVVERWYLWPQAFFELAETNFNSWWVAKDFSRVNYGLYLVKENFRGRREQLKVRVQLGFTKQLGLIYEMPYANKAKTMGIGIATAFEQNNEVNYGSVDNRRIFYKNPDQVIKNNFYCRPKIWYRPGIHQTHILQTQYTQTSISDSLIYYATDYLHNGASAAKYLTLIYQFKLDYRDFVAYPLEGYLLQLDITKHGIGLPFEDGLNTMQAFFNINQHVHFGKRWYGAYGASAKISALDYMPYSLQQGLGYGDFIRGYERQVMDGQTYVLGQSILKYQLLAPRKFKIPLIPWDKFSKIHFAFYLNANFDFGFAFDPFYGAVNPLSNSWLYGTGLGLDFVTYYDKVLRVEYTYNNMGLLTFNLDFKKAI